MGGGESGAVTMSVDAEPAIPRHVAIIMDGNGRWAQSRGLPRIEGHRAGAESVRRVVRACSELGIGYLTLYAFSTENWRRPKAEVARLMRLFDAFLKERLTDLHEYRIRLNTIGEVERLPAYVRRSLARVMHATQNNDAGVLTLAVSYGARAEITTAARRLAQKVQAGELTPEDITEEAIGEHLYTCSLPDPDLVIRTAGEMRLSNFLLWQASYAEFWVTPALWPDFDEALFHQAVSDYGQRCRRFGRVTNA